MGGGAFVPDETARLSLSLSFGVLSSTPDSRSALPERFCFVVGGSQPPASRRVMGMGMGVGMELGCSFYFILFP